MQKVYYASYLNCFNPPQRPTKHHCLSFVVDKDKIRLCVESLNISMTKNDKRSAILTKGTISPIKVVAYATVLPGPVQPHSMNSAFAVRRRAVRWLAGSGEASS